MKKIFTLLLVLTTLFSQAQTGLLAGGGYAPNFTASDINGNSHTLYNYLDSGYVVVLELLSVTCGHCMQHAAGTESSYQTNGPNGNNSARFIGLETNASSSDAAIQNYMSLYPTTFPVCNNISPSAINYQLYYTPGYYVIYPDSSYTTICPAYCQQTGTASTIESLLNTAIAAWPFISGCTDPTAVNYNASATTNDGSCDYTSYTILADGISFSPDTVFCDVGDTINFTTTSPYHNAVEVSETTWLANGNTSNSGFYIPASSGSFIPTNSQTYYYVCQPHASMGMKGVIIASTPAVYGCTDSTAFNYNAAATTDDGSCTYCVWGCMDPSADNFNALATCCDSICYYNGCTDSLAINYDSTANVDDGSCTYTCADNEVTIVINTHWGIWQYWYLSDSNGDTIASSCCNWNLPNYTDSAEVQTLCLPDDCYTFHMVDNYHSYWYNGSFEIYNNGILIQSGGDWSGGTSSPTYDSVGVSIGSSNCVFYGCTDTLANNYWQSATIDDGSCIYYGCTDSTACNYSPIANTLYWCDYSSCYGCTDSLATNYNSAANIDDGSCTYSTCLSQSPTNIHTTNIIHDRATINWNNMNNNVCVVDQYRIKYRELGTTAWSSKTMGAPVGSCTFGTNKTDKLLLNLSPSTTYEYQMKAWYCGGSASSWSTIQTFTTLGECPNIINLQVSTPTTTKATFTWDTTAAYSFARIKARVDVNGSSWFNVGGFGVLYPTLTKNKNGLVSGTSYRAQARTWCDPNGGAYRSATWTSPIFWTQPSSARMVQESTAARKLLRVTDLLGKEVDPNKVIDKTTLLYIYDDGTVEKKIIIE